LNKYKQLKQIGKGGNGIVWKVTDGTNEFAKKTIIRYKNHTAYKRFIDEITVIKDTSHNGIIEILDFFIPTGKNIKSTPYYIMPLGISLKEFLSTDVLLEKTFSIISNIINNYKARTAGNSRLAAIVSLSAM